MNIVPNATLIIQIVHFGIAYQLITRFFCKPVIRELDAQLREQEGVADAIKIGNQHIEQLRRMRYELWMREHQFFMIHKPIIKIELESHELLPPITYQYPTHEQINGLVSQVSDRVIQKVIVHGA